MASAISQRVKAIIFLGDVFNAPNPGESLRAAFYDIIRPVLDAGIQIVYIDGNHDSTLTSPCFLGEKILDNPNFLVVTGEEPKQLFDKNIYAVPYYATKDANWIEGYKDCLIFTHTDIHGADFRGTKSDIGIQPYEARKRGVSIIAGHYHLAQVKEGYHYVGALFRDGFDDAYNVSGYGRLRLNELEDARNNEYEHIPCEDWNFLTVSTTLSEDEELEFPVEIADREEPCVVRVIFTCPKSRYESTKKDAVLEQVKDHYGDRLMRLTTELKVEGLEVKKLKKSLTKTSLKDRLLEFGKERKMDDGCLERGREWLGEISELESA